ncbi:hypothetical protein LBMAG46_20390 [Planctomycetia bacterium]|nr:hypothetical protein LBMAG46_20390 [Planctomycetia bacterium]
MVPQYLPARRSEDMVFEFIQAEDRGNGASRIVQLVDGLSCNLAGTIEIIHVGCIFDPGLALQDVDDRLSFLAGQPKEVCPP